MPRIFYFALSYLVMSIGLFIGPNSFSEEENLQSGSSLFVYSLETQDCESNSHYQTISSAPCWKGCLMGGTTKDITDWHSAEEKCCDTKSTKNNCGLVRSLWPKERNQSICYDFSGSIDSQDRYHETYLLMERTNGSPYKMFVHLIKDQSKSECH